MSAVTHTPGPWVAASHPSSIVGWPIVAQTGRLICNLATPPKDINRVGKALAEYEAFIAECGANARLIAAAPDMLAALSAMVAVARKQSPKWSKSVEPDGDSPLGLALAALAKAEAPHA